MKNLKYIFLVGFSLLFTISCSKFEELNTNPNAASSVAPSMLATQVLKDSYRFWNPNPTDFSYANLYNKHTAILLTNPNPYQYYYSYWPYGSFGSLKRLTDLKRMVEYSAGSTTEDSYKGLALFMKASYGFSITLDLGDIPYSEAGLAEDGITRPKYDSQADVFVAILEDLKAAEALFATGKNFTGDIMFNGDVTKWRKLCNAMQLKVLQTMSKKITAEQKTRFASIVSANNLMVDNSDNFKLVYTDNANATYPFWNGENIRKDVGVSKLVVDALTNLNDYRLFYFAEPAQALIDGGAVESEFAAYQGAPTELNATALALNHQNGMYSTLNKRYIEFKAGDPTLFFTYSEQCFIIAEAIEEGWITGSSQTYYENGVKAMLDYYRTLPSAGTFTHGMAITQSYIDGYFTGAAAYAGTKADRLKQILTQRWLIDFYQGQGGNYYPQFLRTGYPVYPLDPSTSLNPDDPTVYPKRWKYPTDEATKNPENYAKAISDLGGYDGVNIVPWYLK